MERHDWSPVTREHVLEAVRRFEANPGEYRHRPPRNTFLITDGKAYPGKVIRGIAYQVCFGTPISTEDYNGGRQTVRFFERLGFTTRYSSKQRQAPTQSASSQDQCAGVPSSGEGRVLAPPGEKNQTVLARAVLNLGVKPRTLRELGSDGGNADLWFGHRRRLCQVYTHDPDGYRARMAALLAECHTRRADIVLLPACALLHDPGADLGNALQPYREMSRKLPWVVSGALEVTHDDSGKERMVILRGGEVVERFTSGTAMGVQMASLTAYAACSSSIWELIQKGGNVTASTVAPPAPNSPVLALDSGHHQYNGRYARSLRSVARKLAARHGLPSLVALAYWKYRDGQTNSRWLFGDMPHRVEVLRLPSVVGDAGQEDLVSFVSLDLATV